MTQHAQYVVQYMRELTLHRVIWNYGYLVHHVIVPLQT